MSKRTSFVVRLVVIVVLFLALVAANVYGIRRSWELFDLTCEEDTRIVSEVNRSLGIDGAVYSDSYRDSSGNDLTLARASYLSAYLIPSIGILVSLPVILWVGSIPKEDRTTKHTVLKIVCICISGCCIVLFFLASSISVYISRARQAAVEVHAHAPIIYLYDESGSPVNVRLSLDGELTCTYPEYDMSEGWNVTASPDGTLTDMSGETYRFLFWEADLNMDYDLSAGYCVRGCDTAEFLDTALAELGLNSVEAADFKTYWVPFMEGNEYNVITFQTTAYEEAADLEVTPSPDMCVRVNMLWYSSSEYVEIPAQPLSSMNPSLSERSGFVLVEWGGERIYVD